MTATENSAVGFDSRLDGTEGDRISKQNCPGNTGWNQIHREKTAGGPSMEREGGLGRIWHTQEAHCPGTGGNACVLASRGSQPSRGTDH